MIHIKFFSNRLIVGLTLGLATLWAQISCSALDPATGDHGSQVTQPLASGGNQIAPPAGIGGLLPDLLRTTSASAWDFKPQPHGGEYATDLANSRVAAVTDGAALFTPVAGDPAQPLANAAYALYRLRCYQQAITTDLALEWTGDPPAEGTCYIGVSDWFRQAWHWELLPSDGVLHLDPLRFATDNHQALMAVVVLGETTCTLDQVRCLCTPDGTDEYILYAPMEDQTTYLLERSGPIVKAWSSEHYAASTFYLLPNLHLLRPIATGTSPISGTGGGGGLEERDFDNNVVWFADLGAMGYSPHHDIEPLPNGNILVVSWESLTRAEAIAAGRRSSILDNRGLWSDGVIEVRPLPEGGAEVVWEWWLSDHFIQDADETKANYGVVADHPELMDINFSAQYYPDFTHVNSIDYNAELDQIAISLRCTSEFFIIDHSTTTAEAASHSGGRCGIGGDILYRWGNPQAYQGGSAEDQAVDGQHDVNWIPDGYPGAGHLLMFNNGDMMKPNHYSSVVEIIPPLNPDGTYSLDGSSYGPAEPCWTFVFDPPEDMFSWSCSGARRLPNGDTLICVYATGWFLQVDLAGTLVWQYFNKLPELSMRSVFRTEPYYLFTPWLELDEQPL